MTSYVPPICTLYKPYIIGQEDHRETIKVIKSLCVKYAPVTGIAKEIVMAHVHDVC